MRRKVCYTLRRMVFHAIKRLNALKEGFNDKSGKSLKAFCKREYDIVPLRRSAEEGLVFRSF